MKFTLRQLEVFLAIAKHLNVSRAAEQLHMSQSAASAALLSLEQAYDITLFDRIGNKLTLNAAGKTVRIEAEKLSAHCAAFEQMLSGHAELGHLKIGASPTIGNHLASRFLARYMENYPDAEVQLEIANTPDVVSKVLNYEVDIGMIENEFRHRDLELIPWQEDELVVFCAADHPYASKGTLSTKDIKKAKWILREPDSGARRVFEHALEELLPTINVHLEFIHNEAILSAVESGLGIGCLSRIVLEKDFRNGDLVPLKLPRRSTLHRTFYFALHKQHKTNSAVEAWTALCSKPN